jgi:hypothetical protein
MQRKRTKIKLRVIFVLAILLALSLPVLAQVSSSYDLSWHVIGGGGGKMASAGHTLQGTTGQALVGQMSGSGHNLCSGFWCAGEAEYRVYLPLTLRNAP